MKIPVLRRQFRILDFDIENRPLSYWVPDNPTAEITAIAWSWVGESEVDVVLLGPAQTDLEHRTQMILMLKTFRDQYDLADMVTGHYITRHDLPLLNGQYMDWGLETLGPKLAQDTKTDMVRKSDVPATQEYLSRMERIVARKVNMSQHDWRQANRLTIEGQEATRRRVVGDVRQHKRLRSAMLRDGLLRAPRVWRP